ncbi:hypothetical protein MBLNU230_g7378t1 [Neophaeotheca triangularis]
MSFNSTSQSPPPGQGQGQPQRSYSPYQSIGSNAASPYQNAASPPAQGGFTAPPPPKRQRMSPDAHSPQMGSPMNAPSPMPTNGNGYAYPQQQQQQQQHPPSSYGNPYAQSHQQAHPTQRPYSNSPFPPPSEPQHSFNTPDPHPLHQNRFLNHTDSWPSQQRNVQTSRHQSPQGGMPPPPRPAPKEERETRNEDFNDVLAGSGINLKDEEALMYEQQNNRANDSFTSSRYNSSFGSSNTNISNGFADLMQSMHNQPGRRNSAMQGTMGVSRSQKEIDEEMEQQRAKAAEERSKAEQHHMRNPFLQGNILRGRLDRIAANHGVTVNTRGLYEKKQPQANGVQMVHEDGGQGVVAVQSDVIVEQGAPVEQVMALLSLATGERVRNLVDDGHMYARARRYGDRGRVPPDFADIATGEGPHINDMVVPESITGTQWDKVPEHASINEDGTPEPMQTHRYQNAIAKTLNDLVKKDIAAEEARLAKRAARKKAAEAKQNGDTSMADGASTPADAGTPAAGSDATSSHTKITKKERERQAKEKAEQSSGAHAAAHTNAAAVAAIMGKKTKKYSWMNQGKEDKTANRFAKTAAEAAAKESGGAVRTKTEPSTPGATGGTPAPEAKHKPRVWGEWSELGPEGKGIQMRDWILALEKDGKDKKALSWAYDHQG